jgi:hypothetical protein
MCQVACDGLLKLSRLQGLGEEVDAGEDFRLDVRSDAGVWAVANFHDLLKHCVWERSPEHGGKRIRGSDGVRC